MIKELTNEDFVEEVRDDLVLVDFYATWCGPCKMMHPVLEELIKENNNVKIIKINVDNHDELARQYGVMSIPTLVLFKNGNIVEKNIGFTPKDVLKEWLDSYQSK